MLIPWQYLNNYVQMNEKFFIWNLNGTDSPEVNQWWYISAPTCLDRLGSQNKLKEIQKPFTLTKLNTVISDVFTYEIKIRQWIIITEGSKPKRLDDQGIPIHKDNLSLFIEEISLDYDDNLDRLLFDGHTPVTSAQTEKSTVAYAMPDRHTQTLYSITSELICSTSKS